MAKELPLVYIASPYTKGDPAINVRSSMMIFNELLEGEFCIPVCPLWAHFQHLAYPHPYGVWAEWSINLASRCDALLRMPASCNRLGYFEQESKGADEEEAYFKRTGKPVFYTFHHLESWCASWRPHEKPNA